MSNVGRHRVLGQRLEPFEEVGDAEGPWAGGSGGENPCGALEGTELGGEGSHHRLSGTRSLRRGQAAFPYSDYYLIHYDLAILLSIIALLALQRPFFQP